MDIRFCEPRANFGVAHGRKTQWLAHTIACLHGNQLRLFPKGGNVSSLNQFDTTCRMGQRGKKFRWRILHDTQSQVCQIRIIGYQGKFVPPNPNAGTNLMEEVLIRFKSVGSFPDIPRKLVYETNLPAWVSPYNGSLVADFPKTISTNVYPRIESSGVDGKYYSDIRGKLVPAPTCRLMS